MKNIETGNSFIIVLSTGEELIDSLTLLANEKNIKSAWLQGIGSASALEIGYYNLSKQQYFWKNLSGNLEIVSLTGNLSTLNDLPYWHIHGSFTNESFISIGGHIKRLVVGATCELLINKFDQRLSRIKNGTIGLDVLDWN